MTNMSIPWRQYIYRSFTQFLPTWRTENIHWFTLMLRTLPFTYEYPWPHRLELYGKNYHLLNFVVSDQDYINIIHTSIRIVLFFLQGHHFIIVSVKIGGAITKTLRSSWLLHICVMRHRTVTAPGKAWFINAITRCLSRSLMRFQVHFATPGYKHIYLTWSLKLLHYEYYNQY